jgi:ankyrin repeat protein
MQLLLLVSWTNVHVAALSGHEKVVRLFMSNIVDKNLRCNKGRFFFFFTPLLTAIKGGHLNVCKLLIEDYKVDINISDNSGMTPLHLASKMGQLEICKLLCKYVLDKNTLDSDGKTPLDLAFSGRKWKIVSFLKWSVFHCS